MSTKNRLKAYRLLAGLTQAEVSKRTAIPKAVISHWETGRHEPTITDANRYLVVLNAAFRKIESPVKLTLSDLYPHA